MGAGLGGQYGRRFFSRPPSSLRMRLPCRRLRAGALARRGGEGGLTGKQSLVRLAGQRLFGAAHITQKPLNLAGLGFLGAVDVAPERRFKAFLAG